VDAPLRERIVAGTGHWITHDMPELVAGEIRDWMAADS